MAQRAWHDLAFDGGRPSPKLLAFGAPQWPLQGARCVSYVVERCAFPRHVYFFASITECLLRAKEANVTYYVNSVACEIDFRKRIHKSTSSGLWKHDRP